MHRPLTAATLVAPLLIFVGPALADTAESLEKAKTLLAREDGRAAASVLESALLSAAPADRATIVESLRRAYELAARQAEAAGRARDAEAFRDNLRILERKPGQAEPTPRPPDPVPLALPTREVPTAAIPPSEPAQPPVEASETPRRPSTADEDRRAKAEPAPGSTDVPTETPDPDADLKAADAAFRARQYEESGRLYGAMAKAGRLPKSRRDHWGYCRCAEVVRRINAGPRTEAEWSAIHTEIREIRTLSPQNWYGEYLRNLVNERAPASSAGRARSKEAKDRQVVIRGSSPEEPAPSAPPASRPRPAAEPSTRRASATGDRAPQPGPSVGNWQVLMTANFRILHADAALAERVAKAAEVARDDQIRRWPVPVAKAPWSPRCDIYLYPTAAVYSQMTGQPEDSPGFSTMGINAGKVVSRRVNLRADHTKLLAAVPHEVTHVVLADLFTQQQIPRWADEGMAVLAEPAAEQNLRDADLAEPLSSGRLFRVEDLMTTDYPEGKHWGLYYAQSVSLTRFLVDQGTPAQFIQFLQDSQRTGHESQLRQIYKIDGFADLQRRWIAYARSSQSVATASSDRSVKKPADRRRE